MTDKIAEAKAKIDRLYSELQEARLEFVRLMREGAKYKVGDIVEYEGKEYRISRVDVSAYLHYYGNPRKINGKWSLNEKYLTIDGEKLVLVNRAME